VGFFNLEAAWSTRATPHGSALEIFGLAEGTSVLIDPTCGVHMGFIAYQQLPSTVRDIFIRGRDGRVMVVGSSAITVLPDSYPSYSVNTFGKPAAEIAPSWQRCFAEVPAGVENALGSLDRDANGTGLLDAIHKSYPIQAQFRYKNMFAPELRRIVDDCGISNAELALLFARDKFHREYNKNKYRFGGACDLITAVPE
jgi:hypothetical protein